MYEKDACPRDALGIIFLGIAKTPNPSLHRRTELGVRTEDNPSTY